MSGPATAKTAACTTIRDCHGLLVCARATHSGYHSPAPHTARTAPRSRAGEHAQHRVRRAARAPLQTVNVAAYTTTGGRLGLGVCVKAIDNHENPPGPDGHTHDQEGFATAPTRPANSRWVAFGFGGSRLLGALSLGRSGANRREAPMVNNDRRDGVVPAVTGQQGGSLTGVRAAQTETSRQIS